MRQPSFAFVAKDDGESTSRLTFLEIWLHADRYQQNRFRQSASGQEWESCPSPNTAKIAYKTNVLEPQMCKSQNQNELNLARGHGL